MPLGQPNNYLLFSKVVLVKFRKGADFNMCTEIRVKWYFTPSVGVSNCSKLVIPSYES